MDKRFQIFISSTFVDLVDERQSVLKSILELDHMPAGMELFPASDDSAWTLIKDVIDASDYYVLIIGGRYGSQDDEGIGYTEKEYDYALQTKKPVIPLLHQKPEALPREKTETDQAIWQKLAEFREKIESKHTCVYWSDSEELKSKVIVGLTAAIKRHPAVGWVRADQVPKEATIKEILTLKTQVTELQSELESVKSSPPPGTEDLLQGDDPFEVEVTFTARAPDADYYDKTHYQGTISPSWNDIFASVAPVLINEATEKTLRNELQKYLLKTARDEFREQDQLKDHSLGDFSMSNDDLYTCMVQLRALGLIRENDKKRSLRDTATYWTLTPYGDQLLVQLRALSRTPSKARKRSSDATEFNDE